MTNSIHPKALVETTSIGNQTKIGAFSHLHAGSKIGEDCIIHDFALIEDEVTLGNRVTVMGGAKILNGVKVEDDVFIGPNVVFANDIKPRSLQNNNSNSKIHVEKGASIGANVTILPGITIGESAMIGAGSVVTKSVPAFAIIVGNPGKITGYVNSLKNIEVPNIKAAAVSKTVSTNVKGVTIHTFPLVKDLRGDLSVGEFEKDIPFIPRRYFLVFDVPSSKVRGEHAHKICHQFLICVKGSCTLVADDGVNRTEITLDKPNLGVHLPPMTWGTQYKYSLDAVLLVFASEHYDNGDYIRDYHDFVSLINKASK